MNPCLRSTDAAQKQPKAVQDSKNLSTRKSESSSDDMEPVKGKINFILSDEVQPTENDIQEYQSMLSKLQKDLNFKIRKLSQALFES